MELVIEPILKPPCSSQEWSFGLRYQGGDQLEVSEDLLDHRAIDERVVERADSLSEDAEVHGHGTMFAFAMRAVSYSFASFTTIG